MISDALELIAALIESGKVPVHQPRLTDWRITGWSKNLITADLADILSLGAGAIAPVNVDVGAGTTEVALYKPSANLVFRLSGWGMSLGAGAGWGIPFVRGQGGGKYLAKTLLGNLQGQAAAAAGNAAKLPAAGIGTLLAGARAPVAVAPRELEGYTTLVGGDLNFGPNGLGCGLVMFADREIKDPSDLLFVRAFGLVADIHLSTKVSAEISYCSFKTKVEMCSLAFPGAYYGASVAGR